MLPACVAVIVGEIVRYANPAAAKMLGLPSAADIVGQAALDFVHPLDRHRVLARLRRAENSNSTNPPTEMRMLDRQGRSVVVAMVSTHIEDAGQAGVLACFIDMSERAAMEERLRESDESFQRMMNNMQDVFYRTDENGATRYVCPAVSKILGYDATEIIGRPAADFYPDPAGRDALVAAIRQHGFVNDFPGQMRCKDGRIIDISISTQALFDEQGQFAGVEGIWRDITERKNLERRLQRMATHDDLTSIPNRRFILDHLDLALMRYRRKGQALSVMLLDLDHFKRINDTYGHKAGDGVLRRFAEVVEAQRREIDLFGRLGGEEFLLILEDADAGEASGVAERIRHAIEETLFDLGDGRIGRFTVSIGVATAEKRDRRVGDLLERADRALYAAKDAGRNRVCVKGLPPAKVIRPDS